MNETVTHRGVLPREGVPDTMQIVHGKDGRVVLDECLGGSVHGRHVKHGAAGVRVWPKAWWLQHMGAKHLMCAFFFGKEKEIQ